MDKTFLLSPRLGTTGTRQDWELSFQNSAKRTEVEKNSLHLLVVLHLKI